MNNKKGQAAMEFLMTYGWAILAAVIAIGVLAYFGVFSPGKYIPSSAVLTAPFYVDAYNIKTGGITIEAKNNGGETYVITRATVKNSATTCDSGVVSESVDAGAKAAITSACTLVEGETFKGDITVSYTKADSNVTMSSTGTISGSITA